MSSAATGSPFGFAEAKKSFPRLARLMSRPAYVFCNLYIGSVASRHPVFTDVHTVCLCVPDEDPTTQPMPKDVLLASRSCSKPRNSPISREDARARRGVSARQAGRTTSILGVTDSSPRERELVFRHMKTRLSSPSLAVRSSI